MPGIYAAVMQFVDLHAINLPHLQSKRVVEGSCPVLRLPTTRFSRDLPININISMPIEPGDTDYLAVTVLDAAATTDRPS